VDAVEEKLQDTEQQFERTNEQVCPVSSYTLKTLNFLDRHFARCPSVLHNSGAYFGI